VPFYVLKDGAPATATVGQWHDFRAQTPEVARTEVEDDYLVVTSFSGIHAPPLMWQTCVHGFQAGPEFDWNPPVRPWRACLTREQAIEQHNQAVEEVRAVLANRPGRQSEMFG
jgi:hypothetical protein